MQTLIIHTISSAKHIRMLGMDYLSLSWSRLVGGYEGYDKQKDNGV
jgi:hypothetical protein